MNLAEENAFLQAENVRLRAENARLQATVVRLAGGLLLLGALGVALQLRVGEVALAGLQAWGGGLSFLDAPPTLPGLSWLEAVVGAAPALPWLAWLAGLALLGHTAGPPADLLTPTSVQPNPPTRRDWQALAWAALPLLALLGLAAWARLDQLVPASSGISHYPYDDEGVYAGTSQLILQGILPYRDYFFAHPPLAAIAYAPAMAYHFTPWGSPTSFMIARYAAVGYSLAALVAVFAIGWQLGGGVRWGRGGRGMSLPGAALAGTVAGALWAFDGRIVEINRKIMLDQPMILASVAALALYLLAVRRPSSRSTPWLFALTGALAAASALTKIAGLACFLALAADAALRWWAGRGTKLPNPLPPLLGGFILVALLGAGPFVLAAPEQFVREVGFFQVLRPTDCTVVAATGDCSSAGRVADLAANLQNGPTTLLAALGLLVLTAALVWARGRTEDAGEERPPLPRPAPPVALLWRPVVLWATASVVLFTYSRSFYGHYYIQLAAPLCVLGGGVAAWGDVLGRGRVGQVARFAPAVLLVVLLPLVALAGQGVTTPHQDRIFVLVSRYMTDAVPPDAPVLTTDEQFNIQAARAPSHTASGYLIDSYGHMLALGLDLNTRSWDSLLQATLHGDHAADPYTVMHRPAAQADWLARAGVAPLIVVHDRGVPRLTLATLATLRAAGVREEQARYVILNGGR